MEKLGMFEFNTPYVGEIIEKINDVVLPNDYIEFMKKHNGGQGDIGETWLILYRLEELQEINDDYEIDSQRFYFNLSSGQWESIKNVKNKSISCKNSLACKIGDNYFMIQKSEDGYDYTLYTSDYSEIDGGQLDNPDISIYDAMNEILEDLDIEIPGHKDEIDYEELEEKVENAENERINKMLSKHGCTVIAQSDQHTDFLIKSGEN